MYTTGRPKQVWNLLEHGVVFGQGIFLHLSNDFCWGKSPKYFGSDKNYVL